MKKIKLILYFILPILLMASKCNEKNKEPNVMRGRLMYNCTTPASNVKVLLKTDGMKTVEMIDGSKELFTDEDGYFEFQFHRKANKYTLYAPYKTMGFIPDKKYLDLGEVNLGGRMNFIIKLQVSNPYTENDTLYYYDWNYPQNGADHWVKKVAGPFQQGNLDTVVNSLFMSYPLIYSRAPSVKVLYYVNNDQAAINEEAILNFCDSSYSYMTFKIQ